MARTSREYTFHFCQLWPLTPFCVYIQSSITSWQMYGVITTLANTCYGSKSYLLLAIAITCKPCVTHTPTHPHPTPSRHPHHSHTPTHTHTYIQLDITHRKRFHNPNSSLCRPRNSQHHINNYHQKQVLGHTTQRRFRL